MMMNFSRSETARHWSMRKQFKLLWIPLVLLFVSLPAIAQMDQGTITGAVQDKQGAVIPGASVTLSDAEFAELDKQGRNAA